MVNRRAVAKENRVLWAKCPGIDYDRLRDVAETKIFEDGDLIIAAVNALPALLAIAEAAANSVEKFDTCLDLVINDRAASEDDFHDEKVALAALRTALSLLPTISGTTRSEQ